MALYKIQQQVINPMTGESRLLTFQFDPATVSEAEWTSSWPAVQTAIDSLLQSASTSEPTKLADAGTKLPTFT